MLKTKIKPRKGCKKPGDAALSGAEDRESLTGKLTFD